MSKNIGGFRLETWRDVEFYEGLYQVSSLGRVKSLKRETKTGYRGGKILKPSKGKQPYCSVALSRDGVSEKIRVHRLVAKAFLEEDKKRTHVDHINNNKLDNRASNLQWVTHKENTRMAFDDGLVSVCKGVDAGSNKLSEKEVLQIRDSCKNGDLNGRELAEKYNVGQSTIYSIIHRRKWRHI